MKRLTAALFLILASPLAGCGEEASAPIAPATETSGWAAPPVISDVSPSADGVHVTGRAGPGDRIRLTAPEGAAYGATADAAGQFELDLPPSTAPRLFQASILHAGGITPAGGWLFLAPGNAPPGALLRPGAGAQVFEPRALIEAVDYDGGGALVSGRAAPGAEVRVSLDGSPAGAGLADADGRYVVRVPTVSPGAHVIRAAAATGGAAVTVDLAAPADGAFSAARNADGWRIVWPLPGGGVQATWLFTNAEAWRPGDQGGTGGAAPG